MWLVQNEAKSILLTLNETCDNVPQIVCLGCAPNMPQTSIFLICPRIWPHMCPKNSSADFAPTVPQLWLNCAPTVYESFQFCTPTVPQMCLAKLPNCRWEISFILVWTSIWSWFQVRFYLHHKWSIVFIDDDEIESQFFWWIMVKSRALLLLNYFFIDWARFESSLFIFFVLFTDLILKFVPTRWDSKMISP